MTISNDASDAEEHAARARVELAERIASEDADALLAVVGPTASGKTALAIDLAERVNGEIVGADSVQIYRGFDIGSGKPSTGELARVTHHLVGAIDPLDAIDAARWAAMADDCIADIRARGRRPIVCGGSFMWTKALVFGLAQAPAGDAHIRARHRAVAAEKGRTALHEMLCAIDPESAERLHPNDLVRVSRALEVHELTGRKLSTWQAEHAFRTVRHRTRFIGVATDAATSTARIERRVKSFIEAGFVDEVRSLVARGYGDARAMGAVGYREVKLHLDGALAEAELEGAIVRATRVFARRQRTWLHSADVEWL